jgi:hypothetical protein
MRQSVNPNFFRYYIVKQHQSPSSLHKSKDDIMQTNCQASTGACLHEKCLARTGTTIFNDFTNL